MALSVLHAAGIVAQVSVKINRVKLPHVALIVQNHAVQKLNNENIQILAETKPLALGILSIYFTLLQ